MVHQIIIHVIRAQPRQFLFEILFHRLPAAAEILRQFRGDPDLVAHVIALEDLAHRRLAVAVHVGGVVIVDPGMERCQDLLFRFIDIDLIALLRKAHAAEAQDGKIVSVSVFSVLHQRSPPLITIPHRFSKRTEKAGGRASRPVCTFCYALFCCSTRLTPP